MHTCTLRLLIVLRDRYCMSDVVPSVVLLSPEACVRQNARGRQTRTALGFGPLQRVAGLHEGLPQTPSQVCQCLSCNLTLNMPTVQGYTPSLQGMDRFQSRCSPIFRVRVSPTPPRAPRFTLA